MTTKVSLMLNLVLPVIFPSWRFFSSIGPSPRIHYAFLEDENSEPQEWIEFRPIPQRIRFLSRLRNLFYNPEWNEKLYMNTCAERLFEAYSPMRDQEIMARLIAAYNSGEIASANEVSYITYRISALMREGNEVIQQVTFTSQPALLASVSVAGA